MRRPGEAPPGTTISPRSGVEAADEVQQRRLAAARRPEHHHEAPARPRGSRPPAPPRCPPPSRTASPRRAVRSWARSDPSTTPRALEVWNTGRGSVRAWHRRPAHTRPIRPAGPGAPPKLRGWTATRPSGGPRGGEHVRRRPRRRRVFTRWWPVTHPVRRPDLPRSVGALRPLRPLRPGAERRRVRGRGRSTTARHGRTAPRPDAGSWAPAGGEPWSTTCTSSRTGAVALRRRHARLPLRALAGVPDRSRLPAGHSGDSPGRAVRVPGRVRRGRRAGRRPARPRRLRDARRGGRRPLHGNNAPFEPARTEFDWLSRDRRRSTATSPTDVRRRATRSPTDTWSTCSRWWPGPGAADVDLVPGAGRRRRPGSGRGHGRHPPRSPRRWKHDGSPSELKLYEGRPARAAERDEPRRRHVRHRPLVAGRL